MLDQIQVYFIAEKSESLWFVIMGVAAIVLSVWFLFGTNNAVLKGIAIPFMLLGLIQAVVGSTVYFRTDTQMAMLINQYVSNQAVYQAAELSRMQEVNFWFDVYKVIEIIFVIGGILLLIIGRKRFNPFWIGLGIGMFLQGAIMLTLDFYAEARADIYTAQLEQLE